MTFIITLLVFAFLFFFLEIFVPGGILAVIGSLLIITASVLTLMKYGLLAGGLVFALSGTMALFMFFIEVKLLTKSPIGKRFRLNDQVDGSSLTEVDISDITGQFAEVLTPLNPSGKIRIDGKIFEAKSDNGWVEKGAKVRIIRSDVFSVHVRSEDVEPS